jgi:hypothetical protein
VTSAGEFPAAPFADSQPLSAASELEKRAQSETGVDAGCHHALPLGLAIELG